METERLFLRRLRPDDAEKIYRGWATDGEVTRYLTWEPHESIDTTQALLERWLAAYADPSVRRYGIERKEDGVLMGMIDVVTLREGCPELGYCLGRSWWNRGYMTEAVKTLTEELFYEGNPSVFIRAAAENIGSNRVIQKAGYSFLYSEPPEERLKKPWITSINVYRRDK